MKKMFLILAVGFCITAQASEAEIVRTVKNRHRNHSLGEKAQSLVEDYLSCLASHQFDHVFKNQGKDFFLEQLTGVQAVERTFAQESKFYLLCVKGTIEAHLGKESALYNRFRQLNPREVQDFYANVCNANHGKESRTHRSGNEVS